MKAVNSFIKSLGENYYLDFIIDPNNEEVYNSAFSLPVYYQNKFYYELSNNEIHLQRRVIINTVRSLFEDALSEIYIKLSSQDPENFESFLIFNIEAVKLKLKILKADYYVESKQSRYYSVIEQYSEINEIEFSDFTNWNVETKIQDYFYEFSRNFKYSKIDSLDYLEFIFDRANTLSFLPYSLFLIAHKFVVELIKIQGIVNELKEEKQVNPRIKWSGKKTHIGFILGNLALNGFIEAPKNKNQEINFTAYAKLIKQNFEVDVDQDTLRKYLNPEDDKYEENKKSFDKAKFNMPNIIEVS
ncbi:hypothetical protein [Flavobacterium sp. WC2429]|uniref:Uncharacterized protein n=1 Tax=Flavobacterium sp. WC2429 TaxID=3234140 RepID=A0AB39WM77_9FLAO